MVTLTEHEKAELSRAAQAMYSRGHNDLGHLFSGTAAVSKGGRVSVAHYDRVMKAYRAWLVDDEPKAPAPPYVDVQHETAYGQTTRLPFVVRVF